MAKSFDLKIRKTARVVVEGPDDPEQVWMVLHGYGQLAQFFARKFSRASKRVRIIAPEGFHRFYLEGHSGRVGASWMTREERLTDISDYVNYLDQVWEQFVQSEDLPNAAIGFSQGVATLMRWVNQSVHRPDNIIAWGGTFPPDLTTDLMPERFLGSQLFLAFGDSDPLVDPKVGDEFEKELIRQGLHPERIPYNGAHEIDDRLIMDRLL